MNEHQDAYAKAGVSIDRGNALVDHIKKVAPTTHGDHGKNIIGGVGGFASLFRLDIAKYKKPLLVSGTDGVGTKLRLAIESGRHGSVGIDLVAMCANDIICCGADPLFFLDYYASGKLDVNVGKALVDGIAEGCRRAQMALVGGETAEMPDCYPEGEYDLAGFVVGAVDEDAVIDGRTICSGDVLLGLPSSGLHSNGYSLVRKILFKDGEVAFDAMLSGLARPVIDELLEPTRLYVEAVAALRSVATIKGMSHITGGGLTENIPRMLPQGFGARIETRQWTIPAIFRILQERGALSAADLYRTFNCGIGMVVAVAQDDVAAIKSYFEDKNEVVTVIGSVVTDVTQTVEYV